MRFRCKVNVIYDLKSSVFLKFSRNLGRILVVYMCAIYEGVCVCEFGGLSILKD